MRRRCGGARQPRRREAILIGQTLSHYRITAALGAGGMGEVYRATDTTLGREVAIKVLPAELAQDPDRLARFEREAKLLASLNHPNIAHLYGFESVRLQGRPPVHLLAMELVEGADLAERLKRGSVPVDEALALAKQVAEALEEAHEKGIVHRDLKPSNITVTTDGRVKVLDFGLAKAFTGDGPGVAGSSDLSQSPTLAHTGTAAGIILGTAAYMAPEQARGRPVDKRADIWAFGVVLFEMLSGQRLFTGETVSDVLASVLKTEPDWRALPAATPPRIRELLRRCLARDARARLRDIGDARLVLEEALAGATAPGEAPFPPGSTRPPRERTWKALAAASTLLAIAFGALWAGSSRRAPTPPLALRASITLPEGLHLDGFGPPVLALSRDGRTLAFVARGATGAPRLYVRPLDAAQAVLVPGSDTAEGPFFSPDGRWVAFAVGTSLSEGQPPELRKYSLETQLTQTIGPVEDYFGGVWREDDSILFVGAIPGGLWTVPASGGAPRLLVERFRRDDREEAMRVAWPDLLPDGRAVLLNDANSPAESHLVTVDLASGEMKDLGLRGWGARWVPTGHVVYAGLDASLMAVPFDAKELRPKGTPVALAPDTALARLNAPAVAFSHTGTLVRATGYLQGSRREPMHAVALTAAGTRRLLSGEAALYGRGLALSPDGHRLALSTADNTVWVIDTLRGTRVKLPPAPIVAVMGLLWSPDGRSLLLSGPLERGGYGILLGSADGAGTFERLVEASVGEREAARWDPATRTLVWLEREIGVGTRLMRQAPGAQPAVVFAESGNLVQGVSISPDARFAAFDSAASGEYQVYVRPLSGGGERVDVTASGGRFPAWSRDGRTLFFRRGREIRAVAVAATGDGIRFGEERGVLEWDVARSFEVGPDGTFYGVEAVPGAAEQTSLELQTGWFAEVERLTGPAKR